MTTLIFLIVLNIALAILLIGAASSRHRQARRFQHAADLLNAIRKRPSTRVPSAARTLAPGNLGKKSPRVFGALVEEPADAERLAASAGFRLPESVTDPNGRRSRRPWKDPR